MKYLNDEVKDMEKFKKYELGRKKLDAFFEELDKKYPKDTNEERCEYSASEERSMIASRELNMEAALCMRKITVLESQLQDIYNEFDSISFSMMGDPLYGDMGGAILEQLMGALDKIHDMIDYYREELVILGWDELEIEKEMRG